MFNSYLSGIENEFKTYLGEGNGGKLFNTLYSQSIYEYAKEYAAVKYNPADILIEQEMIEILTIQ